MPFLDFYPAVSTDDGYIRYSNSVCSAGYIDESGLAEISVSDLDHTYAPADSDNGLVTPFTPGNFDDSNLYTLQFAVYPFSYTGDPVTTVVYAVNPVIITYVEDGTLGPYYLTLNWDYVSDCDGYKVVILQDPYGPWTNDAYYEVLGAGTTTLNWGDGTEGGAVGQSPPTITPNTYQVIRRRRGYIYFDTSTMPGGVSLVKAEMFATVVATVGPSAGKVFYSMLDQKAAYATAQDLFDAIDDGPAYTSGFYEAAVSVVDLGSQGLSDLAAHPAWLGVGVMIPEGLTFPELICDYGSTEATNPADIPFLRITFDEYDAPVSPITNDGYVKYQLTPGGACGDGYGDWDSNFWVWTSVFYNAPDDLRYRRGYAWFDTSGFDPTGKTITKLQLVLNQNGSESGRDTLIYQQTQEKGDFADAQALFDGLDDGVLYAQGLYVDPMNYIDLGATAISDFLSHPTWFGTGVLIDESSPPTSEDSTQYMSADMDVTYGVVHPYLAITYTTSVGGRRRTFTVYIG